MNQSHEARRFAKTGFLFLISFLPWPEIAAQNFSGEVTTGMKVGWWLYDRGFDLQTNEHLGYDRTHLVVMAPFEVSLIASFRKISTGIGGGFVSIQDDEMIRSNYPWPGSSKYEISDGNLQQWRIYISGEYMLAPYRNVKSGPHLKAGTFYLRNAHPDQSEFGIPLLLEGGWTFAFRTGKHCIIFRPVYSAGHILIRGKNPGEKSHKLLFFGAHVAFRLFGFR